MKKQTESKKSGLSTGLAVLAIAVVILLGKGKLAKPLIKIATKGPADSLVTRGIAESDGTVEGLARMTSRQYDQDPQLFLDAADVTIDLVRSRPELHDSIATEPGTMTSQLQQGPQ